MFTKAARPHLTPSCSMRKQFLLERSIYIRLFLILVYVFTCYFTYPLQVTDLHTFQCRQMYSIYHVYLIVLYLYIYNIRKITQVLVLLLCNFTNRPVNLYFIGSNTLPPITFSISPHLQFINNSKRV